MAPAFTLHRPKMGGKCLEETKRKAAPERLAPPTQPDEMIKVSLEAKNYKKHQLPGFLRNVTCGLLKLEKFDL